MNNGKSYGSYVLWYFAGLSVFTVLANWVCARELVNHRMLFGAFWKNLAQVPGDGSLTAFRVLVVRLLETLFVGWLGRFRQRNGEIQLALCFAGAVTGILASWFTWNTGVLGVFVLLALVVPHTCFYAVAWFLLLARNQYGADIRRFRLWLITVAVMALGIWTELVIHPFLTRVVVHWVAVGSEVI